MSLSLVALVAANLIPLVGVAFFEWSIFEVFALYWSENVVVAFYAVLRILTSAGTPLGARIGGTLFFTVHFGVFCFVHSVFVVALTSEGGFFEVPMAPVYLLWTAAMGAGGTGLLALTLSHGISFARNWLGRERALGPPDFTAPYRRIVVMHLVLILGGFLTMAVGTGPLLLTLLVTAKMVVDIKAHRAERRSLGQRRDGGEEPPGGALDEA